MSITKLRIVLRRLFSKDAAEQELDAELRAYLEHDIDEKIAQGMTPAEARRAALIELGGIEQVKEHVRTGRVEAQLDATVADCRYAVHALRRRVSFTTIAVLTIALGIGAATAMFAIVDNVLLRQLKHKDADRLVTVWGVVAALKTSARSILRHMWELLSFLPSSRC